MPKKCSVCNKQNPTEFIVCDWCDKVSCSSCYFYCNCGFLYAKCCDEYKKTIKAHDCENCNGHYVDDCPCKMKCTRFNCKMEGCKRCLTFKNEENICKGCFYK